MKKWSVNKQQHENALHELLIAEVGSDYALILKKEREKMNDPDVKLDREILAKIHNEVKIQSNRMDYLESKIDLLIKQVVDHVTDRVDHFHGERQSLIIKELESKVDHLMKLPRKVDYLMKRKEEEIDAAGYCVNPTPRFK